jgi:thiosulfate/3-mercaptopyruvate sulfurtransferase
LLVPAIVDLLRIIRADGPAGDKKTPLERLVLQFEMTVSTLVSAQDLSLSLGSEDLLVFDCRFDLADTDKGRREYRQAHIPGAQYAHLDEHLSSPITPDSGRHPLPDMESLCQWLSDCGMTGDKQVVAYDDSGGAMAVRLWWLLKGLGHERVALLDGGWPAWAKLGLPVETETVTPQATDFRAEFDTGLVVSTDELERNLDQPSLQVVDVRSSERFRGEAEPIDPVAGHIPGALNLPLTENLDENGFFKSTQELRALYQPLVDRYPVDNQVYMCGSGVTACHSLLALVCAGYPMPRLYAGSWSEWIRDPARPVATGVSGD